MTIERFFSFVNEYNKSFELEASSLGIQNISSSYSNLDEILPNCKWPPSSLIELLSDNSVDTDIKFLIPTLKQVSIKNARILIFTENDFTYSKSFLHSGIPENCLIFVNPRNMSETFLRLRKEKKIHIMMTIIWIKNKQYIDEFSKLNFVVKTNNSLNFLVKPLVYKNKSSVAPLRLTMKKTRNQDICIQMIKRRGPINSKLYYLKTIDEKRKIHPEYSFMTHKNSLHLLCNNPKNIQTYS